MEPNANPNDRDQDNYPTPLRDEQEFTTEELAGAVKDLHV